MLGHRKRSFNEMIMNDDMDLYKNNDKLIDDTIILNPLAITKKQRVSTMYNNHTQNCKENGNQKVFKNHSVSNDKNADNIEDHDIDITDI